MLSAQLRPTWQVQVLIEPKFPLWATSGSLRTVVSRVTMIDYRD